MHVSHASQCDRILSTRRKFSSRDSADARSRTRQDVSQDTHTKVILTFLPALSIVRKSSKHWTSVDSF